MMVTLKNVPYPRYDFVVSRGGEFITYSGLSGDQNIILPHGADGKTAHIIERLDQ